MSTSDLLDAYETMDLLVSALKAIAGIKRKDGQYDRHDMAGAIEIAEETLTMYYGRYPEDKETEDDS